MNRRHFLEATATSLLVTLVGRDPAPTYLIPHPNQARYGSWTDKDNRVWIRAQNLSGQTLLPARLVVSENGHPDRVAGYLNGHDGFQLIQTTAGATDWSRTAPIKPGDRFWLCTKGWCWVQTRSPG